ncbi:MAG: hypothetical protein Tsb0017_25440 [Geothermobacteraceae bacterium]
MASNSKRTNDHVFFCLLTVLLAVGIFLAASAERLPFLGHVGWGAAIILLAVSLGLFLRRFPLNRLVLALPLATLLAWSLSDRIWPGGRLFPGSKESLPAGLVATAIQGPDGFSKQLLAPTGACVNLFAGNLAQPRMLLFLSDGWLLVSESGAGRVLALWDRDGDHVADERRVFAGGLDRPHGLAADGNDVLVAETGSVLRLHDTDGDHVADQSRVVSTDLPAGGGHWTRSLALDRAGNLLVSVGSDCNACLETDPRRGAILRIDPHTGRGELYASGLRNSVGLAIQPDTGDLWASDNGRDLLGDDIPPDEINRIVEGGDYGWPWCYGDRTPDLELGSRQRCSSTIPPAVALQAHVAPLGLTFGEGLAGPIDWRDDLFLAEHGSWNRSEPVGYQVVRIPFDGKNPAGDPVPLLAGWLRNGHAWGRPVDVAVGPDGALYVTDDRAGVIYRAVFSADGGQSCAP